MSEWSFDFSVFRALQSFLRHVWHFRSLIGHGMAKEDKDKDVYTYKHEDRDEDIENSRWKVFVYHFDDFVNKDKDSDIGSDLMTSWHSCLFLTDWETLIMKLRVNDWQLQSDLDSICNSCDVFMRSIDSKLAWKQSKSFHQHLRTPGDVCSSEWQQ